MYHISVEVDEMERGIPGNGKHDSHNARQFSTLRSTSAYPWVNLPLSTS